MRVVFIKGLCDGFIFVDINYEELVRMIREGKLPYPPRLTKYELAKIIAVRARQISDGAPPLIDPREVGTTDPVAIALEEFKRGLLSFIVVRRLPNRRGSVEYTLAQLKELQGALGIRQEY